MVYDEEIPHRDESTVSDPPLIWRYFVLPERQGEEANLSDEDYVVNMIMWVNTKIENAHVFSSGKNMGCFKGVGYPEEIGEYFMLDKLYRLTPGQRTAAFPQTPRPGGAEPIPSASWILL